jgi:2-C-methyl-D-erythritol 4-phosphate cytidylyltransferase/2-C-methyl-D-erythritol 2,4-cyclodiphosphate synthase
MTDTLWGAVVVAAGTGSRYGGEIPKQFIKLGGKAVISYSVELLKALVDSLVVVTPMSDLWHRWWTPPEGVYTVSGGRRRQDSVMKGLEFLQSHGVTHVLVHDGARPLADRGTVERVIDAAKQNSAVVPVIPVRDTVKRVSGDTVTETVSRENLRLSQTPQGFRLNRLMEILSAAGDVTDEASAFEEAGEPVAIVKGSTRNIKLTDSEDAELISQLSGSLQRVIGAGLDFHPFDHSRPLCFCGCRLSETDGLMGHSDGDVVLHAVADAILSASRLGDIGTMFPPSENRWKDADSSLLLRKCIKMIEEAGWEIQRLDVTVIGEKPKIAPVRKQLISRLAEIAGIPVERVWIKGTTTNTIGDLARGTGVGCSVLAELLRRVL